MSAQATVEARERQEEESAFAEAAAAAVNPQQQPRPVVKKRTGPDDPRLLEREARIAEDILAFTRERMALLPNRSQVRQFGFHTARGWAEIANGEGVPPRPKFTKVIGGVHRQVNGQLVVSKEGRTTYYVLRLATPQQRLDKYNRIGITLALKEAEVVSGPFSSSYGAKAHARAAIIDANGGLGS